MTIRLPRPVVETIRAHGAEAYPEECCGALVGSEDRTRGDRADQVVVTVREARRLPNARDRRYLIDPRVLLALEDELDRAGLSLVGFYHSHPDHPARPSGFDLAHAWPGLSYVVLGVAHRAPGELTSWRLSDDRSLFHPEPLAIAETHIRKTSPTQETP